MLIPIFESYGTIDSYPLRASLKALSTSTLVNAAASDYNPPYGASTTGFTAGMICQLLSESGVTVLAISDGVSPIGIFADDFVDTLKSMMGSFYYLCDNNKFTCQTNYDTSQTYAVNTLLTVVPSGTNQGKLTPDTNYGSQPQLAIVMEAPSDAASDSTMVILTHLEF